MTPKEARIIKAFKNAVTSGQFEPWYATLLMMDTQRFGWISEAVKEEFYNWLDEWEAAHSEPETVELPGIQQAAGDPEYGEPVEEPEETPEAEPEEEVQPDPEESADTVGDTPAADPADEPTADEPTAEEPQPEE